MLLLKIEALKNKINESVFPRFFFYGFRGLSIHSLLVPDFNYSLMVFPEVLFCFSLYFIFSELSH